jgi:hypothetical protein
MLAWRMWKTGAPRSLIRNPHNGAGIVSSLARGLPFVEGALHVDDDQCGRGRWIAAHDLCPFSQTPNAITTAPARPNQVMAYCR